jgi:Tetratricopeptide repeat
LAQAAAYIIDRQLKCAQYRQRFADRRRTLAELLPEHGALPDEQRTTVAATWSLSIELADQLAPPGLARPMLQLASMLDPNGIPIAVLASPPAMKYLAYHRTAAGRAGQISSNPAPVEVSADDAREALYCLHRLNLADFSDDTDERRVLVHGLIQRATRDRLTTAEFDEVVHASAQALHYAWDAEKTPAERNALRANSEALHAHAGPKLWSLGAHSVLFAVGRSLNKDGLIAANAAYWQQLRLAAEHQLGADHPDTFIARSYTVYARRLAGDQTGAVTAVEELLADRQRIHGDDHPHALSTRGLLGEAKRQAGDRAGAIAALAEVVADRRRVLGPQHPATLSAQRRIAQFRRASPRSSERYAYRSEGQPTRSSGATASGGTYLVRWRAADGTEQSMGPFSDAQTAAEVGRWVRRGKGTAVEVMRHPSGEAPT